MSRELKFEVTVLGCGSATPTLRHVPTSQLINHNEQFFLLDCGEGTQLQLRRFKIKFQKINHIMITHLHGDHFLGLPGLLSTLHLLGRTRPMNIFAHGALQAVIENQLQLSHTRLRFPIIWRELNYKEEVKLCETTALEIISFPLSHGIPCCGFKIVEKEKPRNILPSAIEKFNISLARIRQIKQGADLKLEDGTVISNDELTTSPSPPRSYGYCTDTAYHSNTASYVKEVDLLYHESTFLEAERSVAKRTLHSTAMDAARVAKEAGAKKLLLGHYSARYRSEQVFQDEAREVFENTILANEGLTISV
jgi:ribonuclease Z